MRYWSLACLLIAALLVIDWISGSSYGRIALLLAGLILLLQVSPARMFSGRRQGAADALLALGMILLSLPANAATRLFVRDTQLTLVLAILAIIAGSLLVKGGGKGLSRVLGMRNRLWTVLLASAFSLFVILPATRLLILLPIGLLFLLVLAAAAVLSLLREKAGEALDSFVSLFSRQRTILLGLVGILIMFVTLELLGAYVSGADFGIGSLQVLPFAVMRLLGGIFLLFLPLYLWVKLVKVRKSHLHLPDWHPLIVAIAITALAAELLVPSYALKAVPGFVVISSGTPLLGTPYLMLSGMLLLVFLVSCIIAFSHRYLKRVLMAGPLFAGAVFLGIVLYRYFIAFFLQYANELMLALRLRAWFSVAVFPAAFILIALYLVGGFFAFLYELWRD